MPCDVASSRCRRLTDDLELDNRPSVRIQVRWKPCRVNEGLRAK